MGMQEILFKSNNKKTKLQNSTKIPKKILILTPLYLDMNLPRNWTAIVFAG